MHGPNNKIDFNGFSTINSNVNIISTGGCGVLPIDSKTDIITNRHLGQRIYPTTVSDDYSGILTYDISEFNDSYYIMLETVELNRYMTIYEIWLEK